jgi:ABC-type branched-subunit amino acid transport system ATPase component
MTPALETIGLRKNFGGFVATNNVSLTVEAGARHALIGPNGAGKTTIINLLTGVLKPTSGQVVLNGEDITTLPAHARVGRGLSRTFQINQLFGDFTPLESVILALSEREGRGSRAFSGLAAQTDLAGEAAALLERFRLADVMDRATTLLPYGKQRLLEIALAIATRPRVLLLDEPAAGVPSTESAIILDLIAQLPAEIAVLIIEHDMDLVFRFARRITVLVQGAVLLEGTPAEIAADPRVREVYLGERQHG